MLLLKSEGHLMPHPQRIVSAGRLAANRANATRSTGPRSPQGKARSAQNARKHGFTAANFAVVSPEDLHAVANLKADLVSLYRPVTSLESLVIEHIALAQQALLRAAALEAGLFTACLNASLGAGEIRDHPEVILHQNLNSRLAEGFYRLAAKSNGWSLFLRYQAHADRSYRRSIEEFERLKANRGELPNEPIVVSKPEENTATSSNETYYCETNPLPLADAAPSPALFTASAPSADGASPCETNPFPLAGAAPSPAPLTALAPWSRPLRVPAGVSSMGALRRILSTFRWTRLPGGRALRWGSGWRHSRRRRRGRLWGRRSLRRFARSCGFRRREWSPTRTTRAFGNPCPGSPVGGRISAGLPQSSFATELQVPAASGWSRCGCQELARKGEIQWLESLIRLPPTGASDRPQTEFRSTRSWKQCAI